MNISETGNRSAASSASFVPSVTTGAKTYATGNLLVAVTSGQSFGVSPTITDGNGGNTWQQIGSTVNPDSGSNYFAIFYAYGIVGGLYTVTSTWATSYTFVELIVHEFHDSDGAWVSTPADDHQVGNGSSAAIASATVGVTAAQDVIVFIAEADNQNITGGTYTVSSAGIDPYFADGYHITTASEAAVATCSSGTWQILAASFKGVTRGLFRPPSLSGVGVGGSFFRDPLQGRARPHPSAFVRHDRIYVPRHVAAGSLLESAA